MISFPNAKINIGLNVVSKRKDGYHNVETVFYPVSLTDVLEIIPSKKTKITFSGLTIDGNPDENLIIKAYKLLKEEYNLPQVRIHLHKVIPFGAGLGGGSSNGAFTLKMLNDLFQIGLSIFQLENYASKLGADCPFFIQNKPTFATGIGNQFHPISVDLSTYHIIIVKPDVLVGTKDAYQNVIPKNPIHRLSDLLKLPVSDWKNYVENDFEKSVFNKFPQISELKELLYNLGAEYTSMSGSGSSVYGFFHNLPANIDSKIPKGVFIYR